MIPGRPTPLGWRGDPRPSGTAPLGMTKTPTLRSLLVCSNNGLAFFLLLRGHPTTIPPESLAGGVPLPTLCRWVCRTRSSPHWSHADRGATRLNPFGVITRGYREIETAHPLLGDSALSYNPISIGDMIVSSLFHPEDPSACTFDRRMPSGPKRSGVRRPLQTGAYFLS